ncbi:MAG: hypothetical protein ACI4XA_06935, partial [Oscillospiraceae bacterium]
HSSLFIIQYSFLVEKTFFDKLKTVRKDGFILLEAWFFTSRTVVRDSASRNREKRRGAPLQCARVDLFFTAA